MRPLNEVPTYSQSIYDVATACQLARMKRTCKHKFDSHECNECELYVRQYSIEDDRLINLMMVKAYQRAAEIKRSNRELGIQVFFLRLALTLIILFIIWFFAQKQLPNFMRLPKLRTAIELDASNYTEGAAQIVPLGTNQMIWATLRLVARDLERNIDVDGDGRVNCFDAALLFYKHYPEKRNVRIITNYAMGHAFNAVRVGSGLVYIEPQAVYTGWDGRTYSMSRLWGRKYLPLLNSDYTEYWAQTYLK